MTPIYSEAQISQAQRLYQEGWSTYEEIEMITGIKIPSLHYYTADQGLKRVKHYKYQPIKRHPILVQSLIGYFVDRYCKVGEYMINKAYLQECFNAFLWRKKDLLFTLRSPNLLLIHYLSFPSNSKNYHGITLSERGKRKLGIENRNVCDAMVPKLTHLCSVLGFSEEIRSHSLKLLKKVRSLGTYFQPDGLIGGILYIVSIIHGERRSQEEIASYLDTSHVTLRTYSKKIKRIL